MRDYDRTGTGRRGEAPDIVTWGIRQRANLDPSDPNYAANIAEINDRVVRQTFGTMSARPAERTPMSNPLSFLSGLGGPPRAMGSQVQNQTPEDFMVNPMAAQGPAATPETAAGMAAPMGGMGGLSPQMLQMALGLLGGQGQQAPRQAAPPMQMGGGGGGQRLQPSMPSNLFPRR